MSKNKTILVVIILLVFAIVCVIIISVSSRKILSTANQVVIGQNQVSTTSINTTQTSTKISTSSTPIPQYTLVDVSKHRTSLDCWTAINGKVYSMTSWIKQHPGGSKAIISLCGIDGSTAYNGKHKGQSKPMNELTNFLIGNLI